MNKKSLLIFSAVIFLIVLILIGKVVFKGEMIFGIDLLAIYYPFRFLCQKQLALGELPLWIPHIFGGMPLLASMNAIVYYPTDLIGFLIKIPLWLFYNFDYMIHLSVAGLGTILYCRRRGISSEGAVFGGILYTCSGYLITILHYGTCHNLKAACLIPLTFFLTDRAISKSKFSDFIWISIPIAMQILSTGIQIMAYSLLIEIAYFIVAMIQHSKSMGIQEKTHTYKNQILHFGLMLFFAFGISCAQLIPSFEYNRHSTRSNYVYEDAVKKSFQPEGVIEFLLPNFFGFGNVYLGRGEGPHFSSPYLGVLPLILIIWLLLSSHNNIQWDIIFWIIVFFVSLLMSFGSTINLYYLVYLIPGFSGFRGPSRFLILTTFSVAVISAKGVDALKLCTFNNKPLQYFKSGFIIYIFILVIITIFIHLISPAGLILDQHFFQKILPKANSHQEYFKTCLKSDLVRLLLNSILCFIGFQVLINRTGFKKIRCTKKNNLIYSNCHFGVSNSKRSTRLFWLMPVLLFFDLYWFDFPFIKGIEPGEIQGNGQLYSYLKNEKNVSRIVSQEPLERQNQCIYYDLCNLGGYHGLPLNIYKKTFDKFKQNPLPFYNLMGVNYLISAQEFSHSKFQKVISFPPWNIYRLTFTMPKAWFVWKQRVFENEDTLLNVLNSPEFNPFEEILLVQEPSGINTESFEQGQGRIVLKKYGYNEIILEIQAPASCFLMLNEFFYPEWKAHIDNKSVKIFQADYFLRAIPVKEGSHKVVLYYSKQKAVGGIIISCIFLLAFLTIAVITLKKT